MINVTIKHRELRDLFVTIVDVNVATGQCRLNGDRFNKEQSKDIGIQEDGDGLGHIRWQVNVASEPLTMQSDEATALKDGATVEVHA